MKLSRILFFIAFCLLNLIPFLRIVGIALFIGNTDIFWIIYICNLLAWGGIFFKTKKALFAILPICSYGLLLIVAMFRVGVPLGTTHTTSITSSNHSVIVKEYDRPVHSCCAFYKKCFLNFYYLEYMTDTETKYYPYYEKSGNYEWNDKDTLQLCFPYSKGSEKYKTIIIHFD